MWAPHGAGSQAQGAPRLVPEGELAREIILALQGVVPAILQLDSGRLRTASLKGRSLASLLRPVIDSGVDNNAHSVCTPCISQNTAKL